jgi:threonine dehydratase
MYSQIVEARRRLQGHAHVTPVMTSRTLDDQVKAAVFFKCENLQKIGAFKFRGAFNAISRLPDDARRRGVLTFSSGNHGQAVARVGKMLGIETTVVMPKGAPRIKQEATAGYGAHMLLYDPEETGRESVARELEAEKGYTLIPPYDHEDIIAGQGTAAMEMIEAIGQPDLLLVPCGGGGLLSGSAVAAKQLAPACRVIGIEPETADDATRSFHSKTLCSVKTPSTIADGVRTPSLGRLTFPLVLSHVDDMKTVSEAAIMDAVAFLFHRMKLVVEPSGALGLAALLSGAVSPAGRVGVIISGGNIDGATLATILNR